MKIAIASGKGGTGKTTVAVSLARIISTNYPTQYVDCDVEEPNGHLFLNPSISATESAGIPVPQVDDNLCIACGECSSICQFNAIAVLTKKALVFSELCHGCGGCTMVCPQGAITETDRSIGIIDQGLAGEIAYIGGRLNVGEAMSPPLIKAVKKYIHEDSIAIIDTPPGTSCPVVTALRGADTVVLVVEPSAFGLNDLKLAVDMVKQLDIPAGVIINRSDIGDDRVERYCREEHLPVWGRILHDRKIAEAYSNGIIAVDIEPDIAWYFGQLADTVLREASNERNCSGKR